MKCVLQFFWKKESLANFAQTNSVVIWVGVWPGRSSVVTQCICRYVAIDKNGNFAAVRSCFRRSGPISRKGVYSSCGSILALVLGGKLSFYENCLCCILYSKNLHFHYCLKIQHILWCPLWYSGIWYRAELCYKLCWTYGQVYKLKKIKKGKRLTSFWVRKWYVSVKLVLIAFQLASLSKWNSHTNVVFCFYMLVSLERCVMQVTEQGLNLLLFYFSF